MISARFEYQNAKSLLFVVVIIYFDYFDPRERDRPQNIHPKNWAFFHFELVESFQRRVKHMLMRLKFMCSWFSPNAMKKDWSECLPVVFFQPIQNLPLFPFDTESLSHRTFFILLASLFTSLRRALLEMFLLSNLTFNNKLIKVVRLFGRLVGLARIRFKWIMNNAINAQPCGFTCCGRRDDYIFHMISGVAIYHRRITCIKRWNWYSILLTFRKKICFVPKKMQSLMPHYPIHIVCLRFDASLLFTFHLILWSTTRTPFVIW